MENLCRGRALPYLGQMLGRKERTDCFVLHFKGSCGGHTDSVGLVALDIDDSFVSAMFRM